MRATFDPVYRVFVGARVREMGEEREAGFGQTNSNLQSVLSKSYFLRIYRHRALRDGVPRARAIISDIYIYILIIWILT